jgi:hypothetical protein
LASPHTNVSFATYNAVATNASLPHTHRCAAPDGFLYKAGVDEAWCSGEGLVNKMDETWEALYLFDEYVRAKR